MSNPTNPKINEIMARARACAAVFSQLDQQATDRIVRAAYEAGFRNRIQLAKLAHAETGIGRWEDKVIKNVVATQFVYEDLKDLKTVGVIHTDFENGITEIAQPLGPILGVIPSTNPTSTVMFKILISLKTRNPIILSFHPRAVKCSAAAARALYEAALAADAPEYCVQWMEACSLDDTNALMSDRRMSLILATGGESLVHAAYSSGTPALGVGPGNVPVFIERSADAPFAVEQIMISKTFDNGTICASEQALIVEAALAGKVEAELKKAQAYFVPDADIPKLENAVFDREKGLMQPAIVGKPVAFIAQRAGLQVPPGTRLLVARQQQVGKSHPLSCEILAPVIAYYVAKDFDQAVNLCIDLNFLGGMGHTVCIYSNAEDKIREFAMLMNAGRIVVNTPSSQGAVGGIYNTLHPSLTLGCGSGGRNITTDNVTARNLLNIQRVARRRNNQRLERFNSSLYFDEQLGVMEIEREFNRNY